MSRRVRRHPIGLPPLQLPGVVRQPNPRHSIRWIRIIPRIWHRKTNPKQSTSERQRQRVFVWRLLIARAVRCVVLYVVCSPFPERPGEISYPESQFAGSRTNKSLSSYGFDAAAPESFGSGGGGGGSGSGSGAGSSGSAHAFPTPSYAAPPPEPEPVEPELPSVVVAQPSFVPSALLVRNRAKAAALKPVPKPKPPPPPPPPQQQRAPPPPPPPPPRPGVAPPPPPPQSVPVPVAATSIPAPNSAAASKSATKDYEAFMKEMADLDALGE